MEMSNLKGVYNVLVILDTTRIEKTLIFFENYKNFSPTKKYTDTGEKGNSVSPI